jgi:hypothetical protein
MSASTKPGAGSLVERWLAKAQTGIRGFDQVTPISDSQASLQGSRTPMNRSSVRFR